MRRFVTHIVPLALYTLFIILVSTREVPDVTGGIWNMDKLYHAGAYGVMGMLAARAVTGCGLWTGRGRLSIAAGLAAAVFSLGGALELYQAALPAREGDVVDALFNGAGGFVGSACWVWFFGPARQ